MEGDLRRLFQVRYSDRWRFDEQGNRKLTLREISVLLEDLPGDSRVVKHFNGGQPRWAPEAYLLADLIHIQTGKPHPARPTDKNKGVDKRETAQRAKIRRQRIAARNKRQLAAKARAEAAPAT